MKERIRIKALLAGCVVCLISPGVQAAEPDLENPFVEEIEDDTTENSIAQKTGTIASSESSVTLMWPLEEEADFGYYIYVKKKNRYVRVGKTGPGENRFLLDKIKGKPLEAGTSYDVKVVALKRKGKKKKVVCYRMIRTATIPEPPTIARVKRKRGKKADIRWKPLLEVSGYELQLSEDPDGTFQTVGYYGKNKNRTILRKIRKKKNYYIRIRAYKIVTGGRVYGKWSELRVI